MEFGKERRVGVLSKVCVCVSPFLNVGFGLVIDYPHPILLLLLYGRWPEEGEFRKKLPPLVAIVYVLDVNVEHSVVCPEALIQFSKRFKKPVLKVLVHLDLLSFIYFAS